MHKLVEERSVVNTNGSLKSDCVCSLYTAKRAQDYQKDSFSSTGLLNALNLVIILSSNQLKL